MFPPMLSLLLTALQLVAAPAVPSSPLVPYRSGKLWGLSDTKAKPVVPPRYSRVNPLGSRPFFQVAQGELEGVCDAAGREILKPEWKRVMDLEGIGFLLFRDIDSNGFADLKGRIVVPPRYSVLRNRLPDSLELIEPNGDRSVYLLATGRIVARPAEEPEVGMGGVAMGRMAAQDPQPQRILVNFERHLSPRGPVAVRVETRQPRDGDPEDNVVLTDTLGLEAEDIQPVNDSCRRFVFAVRRKGKWGVVDSAGKTLLPPVYDSVLVRPEPNDGFCREYDLQAGLAVRKGKSYGVVDLKGKVLQPFDLDSVTHPGNRGFLVLHRKGLRGVHSRLVRFAPLLGPGENPQVLWPVHGLPLLSIYSPEDEFVGHIGNGGVRYYRD